MAKKKSQSKDSRTITVIRNLIFFAGIVLLGYLFLRYKVSPTQSNAPVTEQIILQRAWDNYYKEVDSVAKSYHLNPAYLMSLIVLECSGRKAFDPRFEEHIYSELKKARDTKGRFGTIKHKTISDANDDALKNLASSWGPFQLMGYQCIELDVRVHDIRGEHAVYWGTYWIYKRYGKYLKKKDYENAFHIHNTGKPIPKNGMHTTHNPNYVNQGMAYMKFFENKIAEERQKDSSNQ